MREYLEIRVETSIPWSIPVAVAGVLLALLPPPGHAQEAGREVIAYTSLRPPNQDIFLVDGTGGSPRRLTDHPGLDFDATFSPDGRWAVFASERRGNVDLYALDLETGGTPVRLTKSPAFDAAPDVGPRGERIAFVSTRDGNADVFVMPFAPGDTSVVAENRTRHPLGDFRPAFSPDGTTIAFSRQNGRRSILALGTTAIHLMDADGSDVRHLVGSARASAGSPAWSDDGETVYYHRVPGDTLEPPGPPWGSEIWRVDASGSDAAPVVSLQSSLALSPSAGVDGRIVFHAGPVRRPGDPPSRRKGGVYSAAPDGSSLRAEVDSTAVTACLVPDAGPGGRVLCHGPDPTDGLPVIGRAKTPLRLPGSSRAMELPDRTVDLVPLQVTFPDFGANDRISYVFGGRIFNSRLDGEARRVVADMDSLAEPWGTSSCRRDGTIAFSTGPSFAPVDAPVDIWTIQDDGTRLTRLTADSTVNDAFPAWSDDCETIVFRSTRDGNKEIYIMDADGSDPRRLTHHEAVDTAPDISPDGEWVAFSTTRSGPGYQIRIQRIDGSEGRFLEPDRVPAPGRDMHPRFSPDGEWIVFTSSRRGMADEWLLSNGPQPYGDLWAVPVEGGDAVRLTNDKWEDGLARWNAGR